MSNSWWDRQFSKTVAPRPKVAQWQQPVARPTPQFRTSVDQQYTAGYTNSNPESTSEAIHDSNYQPKKPPPSAKQQLGNCPECDSTRFFSRSIGGGRQPAPSCFDCGYKGSAMYYHDAASVSGSDAGTPIVHARGDTGTGWNPGVIIGRV